MALFRGRMRRRTDPRPAIEQFWHWWDEHRGQVVAAADGGDAERVVALLRPVVTAVDSGLEFDFGAGRTARRGLTVTGARRPGLRAISERWLLAAPPADDEVEYAATRRRDPKAFGTSLTIDDYEIPLAELVAATRIDQQRPRLDVVVHHPLFPLLDAGARQQVAFIGLQAALGEDDMERWLGVVDVTADPPMDAFPVSGLAAVVDQLQPSGSQWVVLTGSGPGGQVLATARRPFNRVDRPLCELHVGVSAGYRADARGLPADDDVAAQLRGFEGRLVEALGGDGPYVVLIGDEAARGRMMIHLYVDQFAVDVAAVRPILAQWPGGKATLATAPDPEWRRVGHLLG